MSKCTWIAQSRSVSCGSLKLVASPTYVSVVVLVVTVAWYTMWFVRHCPSRGPCSFFLQLHSLKCSVAGVDV